MPDDPDYPMNLSTRWTKDRWKEASALRAHATLSGKVMNPETLDVTVEAVGRHVTHVLREGVRTFAWLELIDHRTATTNEQLERALERITQLESSVQRLESAAQAQTAMLTALATGLGLVTVPDWQSLQEISDGDSMGGLQRPSADSLGLSVVYDHHRDVPGRQHEEILAIEPLPGGFVPRGTTVTVSVNLNG